MATAPEAGSPTAFEAHPSNEGPASALSSLWKRLLECTDKCTQLQPALAPCFASAIVDLDDNFDTTFVEHIRLAAGDSSTDERERFRSERRLRIMGEVVSTERSYVNALRLLERVYSTPLRLVADKVATPRSGGAIFSHEDLDLIFSNISLITIINSKFLETLDHEWKSPSVPAFGRVIAEAAKQMRGVYTRYICNYAEADRRLSELKANGGDQQRYLDVCRTHPDAKGLDLR